MQLFITCLVDSFYPETGEAIVSILRRLGITVEFPHDQTCCGQPPFNAGLRAEARPIVEHTPEVTLVRTSAEENARLGQVVVERLHQSEGPLTVVVPLQGFSLLSEPGKPFHDPEADRAFLDVIVDGLGADRVVTVEAPLNSDEVAATILRVSESWRREG